MKKFHKIMWKIFLFMTVATSFIISFKLYNNLSRTGTLMLFGDAIRIRIYKHEEIYTMIQFANFMIMLLINEIGHTIEWGIGKNQNIHFYGITNTVFCFTMVIIEVFKYEFEYIFVCPELKAKMLPITLFIEFITVLNFFGYIFMIIRNKRIKTQKNT